MNISLLFHAQQFGKERDKNVTFKSHESNQGHHAMELTTMYFSTNCVLFLQLMMSYLLKQK